MLSALAELINVIAPTDNDTVVEVGPGRGSLTDILVERSRRVIGIEIDRALAKIDAGTYGLCEQCGQPIVRARLEALPYAALCVACKSGGLSRR